MLSISNKIFTLLKLTADLQWILKRAHLFNSLNYHAEFMNIEQPNPRYDLYER